MIRSWPWVRVPRLATIFCWFLTPNHKFSAVKNGPKEAYINRKFSESFISERPAYDGTNLYQAQYSSDRETEYDEAPSLSGGGPNASWRARRQLHSIT